MRQQSESKLPVQSLFSLGLFFTLLAGTLFSGACVRKGSSEQKAYTAEQSLAAMEFSEDFHAEVFLKEPQVMSPVEMAFDEDGRIYVAEMLDYPDDPPAGKPARSRIRLLQDLDGDGVYEKTTIFAEHVLEVSSILPWNGGLLVTSAPDILWLKDQDGDGKADVRKVLFTGFPLVNPEARVTNLRYGIDNWIYVANNGSDGRITSPEHPEHLPVLVRGQDVLQLARREIAAHRHQQRGIGHVAGGVDQGALAAGDDEELVGLHGARGIVHQVFEHQADVLAIVV